MSRGLLSVVALIALLATVSGCGDRAATIGNPCKENSDCDTGALRGVCMKSVMSGGYCTMLCEKDAECVKPGFTCGDAEITTKGLITTSKQDARYCTKPAAPLYKPK